MPSLLPDLPAAEIEVALLNQVDGYSGVRNALRTLAEQRGEWAGIPMPMEGNPLIVEPTYPKAYEIMEIGRTPEDMDVAREAREFRADKTMINSFYSSHKRADIIIWRDADGRTDWGPRFAVNNIGLQLSTLHAADAWGIEQEANAIKTLGTLLRHRQFKQYLLTGMFMEKSERSGVHYLFRKLRPTIACSERGGHPWSLSYREFKILCTLCMHPIGYYDGSWAGAMCPTDDVLAHLLLCRGDEHMFWRRANQHPPWRPEAGL